MKSLFDNTTFDEVVNRIHSLSENSAPEWGRMSVGQMLNHCQRPLEVALGNLQLAPANFMMRLMFKMFRSSLYNDRPWKKGMPTAREFLVTDDHDFRIEQKKLLKLITEFYNKKEQTKWPRHPSFGKFTPEQWGQMQYKHLDHHLRQFKV